jgi:hypothetical protein
MDVMGQQALLHAWSLVVDGRDEEVPAMLGAREDAVERVVETARAEGKTTEPLVLQDQRLSTFGMIGFGLRFAWGMLREPTVVEHSLSLAQRD